MAQSRSRPSLDRLPKDVDQRRRMSGVGGFSDCRDLPLAASRRGDGGVFGDSKVFLQTVRCRKWPKNLRGVVVGSALRTVAAELVRDADPTGAPSPAARYPVRLVNTVTRSPLSARCSASEAHKCAVGLMSGM